MSDYLCEELIVENTQNYTISDYQFEELISENTHNYTMSDYLCEELMVENTQNYTMSDYLCEELIVEKTHNYTLSNYLCEELIVENTQNYTRSDYLFEELDYLCEELIIEKTQNYTMSDYLFEELIVEKPQNYIMSDYLYEDLIVEESQNYTMSNYLCEELIVEKTKNNTMSNYLCEELIVEIFLRLPPKSLLRFRSVSKSLRSCIDSPDFIRMHTCRSPQRLVLTHVDNNRDKILVKAAFCTLHPEDQLPLCPISGYIGISRVKFPCTKDIILGSCHGILCLIDYEKRMIALWNPSIMRQLTLPDCRPGRNINVQYGLGFDPITDDHKIVSIPTCGDEGERSFVYAIKTGAWLPIASPIPLYREVVSRACHLNGVLHWAVDHWPPGEDCWSEILTFDLKTHVFGTIALPRPSWETRQLAIIQGSLAAISRVLGGDSWIWVRRDASWSVVFKSGASEVDAIVIKVLEMSNNGDLLLDTFCEGLQVYNPKTGARSTLMDSDDNFSLYAMDSYVESLHLLDKGSACDVSNLVLQDKKRKKF